VPDTYLAGPYCGHTWPGGQTSTGTRVTHECDREPGHPDLHICNCGAVQREQRAG
jgi:hypothetical protein